MNKEFVPMSRQRLKLSGSIFSGKYAKGHSNPLRKRLSSTERLFNYLIHNSS